MPLTGLMPLSLRIRSSPLPSGSSMSLIRSSTSAGRASRMAAARFAAVRTVCPRRIEHRGEVLEGILVVLDQEDLVRQPSA